MHTMQLVCIINQHPRSQGDSRRRDKRNRDKSRGSSEFEVVDENRQRLDSNYEKFCEILGKVEVTIDYLLHRSSCHTVSHNDEISNFPKKRRNNRVTIVFSSSYIGVYTEKR